MRSPGAAKARVSLKESLLAPGSILGVGIRGSLGDINPLNKLPFQKANSRVKKGPLQGVSLILPRICGL